jgi:hypothetical protein
MTGTMELRDGRARRDPGRSSRVARPAWAAVLAGALTGALTGALGACAAPPRLALPPEPVAVVSRTGELPLSRVQNEIVVRAFLVDAEGMGREVGGADCRLETDRFLAEFRSPGRVVVPVMAVSAPALEVTCRAGEREGFTRQPLLRRWISPYPDGFETWRSDPWGQGAGAWIGLPGDPPWRGGWWGPGPYGVFYPDVTVRIR